MKVVFFGTSGFAAEVLKFLLQNNVSVVAVVTRPDRLQGRSLKLSSPPVKAAAGLIPVFQPPKASTSEFAATLKELQADLFIVVAYGEIIKPNILTIPSNGCMNVHASLLPKYRGAAPMQRCLMQGESETGITIMQMDEGLDSGPILEMEKIPISPELNLGELERRLCSAACPLLLRVIHALERGPLEIKPQDHTQATFAPKITPADEEIVWDRSAKQIHNQIRALSPKPGAWCFVQIDGERKRLKILRSQLTEEGHGLLAPCMDRKLRLLEVQLEGKKAMAATDFLRGLQGKILSFCKKL